MEEVNRILQNTQSIPSALNYIIKSLQDEQKRIGLTEIKDLQSNESAACKNEIFFTKRSFKSKYLFRNKNVKLG
jgi:hypothetical protein